MTISKIAPLHIAVLAAVATVMSHEAGAQTTYFFRHPDLQNPPTTAESPPDGDWNLDTNGVNTPGGSYWWEPGLEQNFVPFAGLNEFAAIENGGTAYVQSDGGVYPGEISIGVSNGTSGAVEIRSGGVMRSQISGSNTTGNVVVGSSSGVGSLSVLPGGTLTIDGTLASGSSIGNSVVVGGSGAGTATLSAAVVTSNSLIEVYPNANFDVTGPLGFSSSGNSEYRVNVSGNNMNGKIVAGGNATLNGQLSLNFDSYSPTLGHNWTVIEANSFSGSFNEVSVSGANLPFNQQFVFTQSAGAESTTALKVGVEEVLVLQVNRDTGTATITHPGSGTINFDGYYVGSKGNLLSDDPNNWDSLSESGQYGADWFEEAQRTDNVGEVKVGSDATFGSIIELGNIYNALAGEFAQDVDDLEFVTRRSSDGAELRGVVQYTGTKANTLVLQVDPSGSGDAYLRNTSQTTVQIDSYEILSETGSLDATGLTGIDNAGTDWIAGLSNDDQEIREFNQSFANPFLTLPPLAAINLGAIFDGGDQDLDFNFLQFGESTASEGLVVYEEYTPPTGLPGDFNEDDVVNLADYTVWRNNLGSSSSLPNDGDLGTPISADHYALWKSQFGQAALGALELSNSQVPEPASLILTALPLGMLWSRRRRS